MPDPSWPRCCWAMSPKYVSCAAAGDPKTPKTAQWQWGLSISLVFIPSLSKESSQNEIYDSRPEIPTPCDGTAASVVDDGIVKEVHVVALPVVRRDVEA